MSDSAETAANWQGIVSSLIFASVVLAVVWLTFACCSGAVPEFFYPRLWRAKLAFEATAGGTGGPDGESTGDTRPAWQRRVTVEARHAAPSSGGSDAR